VVLKDERKGQVSAGRHMEWSRLHMAAYKVPRLVDFIDAFPPAPARSNGGPFKRRSGRRVQTLRFSLSPFCFLLTGSSFSKPANETLPEPAISPSKSTSSPPVANLQQDMVELAVTWTFFPR